jgi:hypothetical protein
MKLVTTILALAALSIGGTVAAATKASPFNVDKQGVALHGYDPVSYFELAKPEKGSPTIAFVYMRATFRFASEENRKKFMHDQHKYLPQYGGFCAKAVSDNKLADIDPLAYKIVDGKLYLNYDHKIQLTWEKDIPERIAEADKNWPALRATR